MYSNVNKILTFFTVPYKTKHLNDSKLDTKTILNNPIKSNAPPLCECGQNPVFCLFSGFSITLANLGKLRQCCT